MYLKSITLLTVALLVAIVHGKGLAFYDSNGGQYMAVMTSGDVGDFGYNYIINAGRVQMESLLNMSNTLFIPNVLDNYSAIAVAEDLVQKGYRVIVSGTFAHGNAMTVVASRYPNVTFVQYGSRSTLPNLSFVVWSNAEFWFAIGVFCGATAQNNKVGFIHPGPVEGSIQSINAFYSGVKYANQSLEVYTMYTGAFIAVDRAQGASDYLLNEIGVGSLSGQQDDLTIPLAAMKAGLLAVGVTGYSLRQLYGELVGVSFVRDWTSALANFSAGVSGRVYKGDISANFRSGGQYTDAKSHLVTQEQWDILQGALTQIKAGRTIFYCGPWMAEFGLNNATGCLNSTGIFNTKILSDVRDLGYYFVPTIDISFPVNTLIGLVVTTCLLLLLPLGLAISVIALRNTTEIKAGSPFFFLVMIVGCTIVYVGVLIWPLDPSEHRCYARIWLPSIGSTIAIGALITKNIRIFLLFFNPFKFRAENLAIKNFFPIVLVLLAFNFVILGIYTGAGPRGVTVLQGVQGLGKYETRHVCATSDVGNAIVYAILAYHMLQLIAGCVVSFMLRNVTNKEFNERKSVAMAIYVITFCLVIVAVLVGVTNITNEQLIVFVSVALLICNTGALLIIFGSRFIKILVKDVDPIGFTSKMSKSPSGTANSGTGRTRSGSEDSTSSAAAPPSPAVPKAPPILTTAV